jgi:hypothetical protein
MVVQNLVDLNTSLFEFCIDAVLQVRLAEPPMLIVEFFRKDLPDVALLHIFATVSKGPWLRYIFPTPECQLLWVSMDMQPLLLNGAPPLPGPVCFLFMKLCFGLLSMAVHGFFYLVPMESLDNSNGILISRPTQNIYNLERPSKQIYNLKFFRTSMHV